MRHSDVPRKHRYRVSTIRHGQVWADLADCRPAARSLPTAAVRARG